MPKLHPNEARGGALEGAGRQNRHLEGRAQRRTRRRKTTASKAELPQPIKHATTEETQQMEERPHLLDPLALVDQRQRAAAAVEVLTEQYHNNE